MSATERQNVIGIIMYWGLTAASVIALKQFYSTASAVQLQWQLRPLVFLLELFSDLHFEPTATGEWLDSSRRISIVKSCAGVNFLIISLLGHLVQRHEDSKRLRLLIEAPAVAWLTALTANTLRVLLSVYGEHRLSILTGLAEADCHRAIGIGVYFLCLWGQLACHSKRGFGRSAVSALVCYLSITLAIPLLRTGLMGLEPIHLQHVASLTGIPVAAVVLGFFANSFRSIYREGDRSRSG
ncbi:MAG: exosortase K [Gammaproteobacteria bacterium]